MDKIYALKELKRLLYQIVQSSAVREDTSKTFKICLISYRKQKHCIARLEGWCGYPKMATMSQYYDIYVHIYIYTYMCAKALDRAAAKRKKRFFPKITARLVFEIKSSFFSPFLVNGYILSYKCQKCQKIILSHIYVELCYSKNEIFHILRI